MWSIKPNLYFAAPLFNEGERAFNRRVVDVISRWFEVYLPQRDGGLLTNLVDRGVEVAECDMCLIVLDGRSVDEGAAFELGMCFSLGKPCYGFQSDSRRLLPIGNNPMIQCALRHVFRDCGELYSWAQGVNERGSGEPATVNGIDKGSTPAGR
jgi:nucleoside 2-deoxyribosyltransferase